MRGRILTLGLGVAIAACGSDSPATPGPLNLTGNWTGQLGEAQSGTALRLTWTAVHNGGVAAGTVTIVKPAQGVVGTGQMTATVDGSQLALTINVPPGGVAGVPACTILGAGVATAHTSLISGTLTATFTACQGTGLEAPPNPQLSLTKS